MIGRRSFLRNALLGGAGISLPFKSAWSNAQSEISFGVVADPHKDLLHDVDFRMETFLEATENNATDFIIQLGDFCFPKPENSTFLNLWNSHSAPTYHVLGNHDMDISSKQETMEFWEMLANYYSFDFKGYHFVVLDANFLNYDGKYKDYDSSNFYVDSSLRTWIDPEQLEWLAADLRKTVFPTIIFSHQSLVNDLWGVKNRSLVQRIFEKENNQAGHQKILACFNGHNHIDAVRRINDVYYIDINSMSYQWLGEKYQSKVRYPEDIYQAYPNIINMATYQDALFAFVNISENGLQIRGIESEYVGPSPAELGLTDQVYGYEFTAKISSNLLEF